MDAISFPLRMRMQGPQILLLHKVLLLLGYEVIRSDLTKQYFGTSTRDAVKSFQRDEKLKITGVVDRVTAAKLIAVLVLQGPNTITHKISGTVSNSSGKKLSNIIVEAWDKDKRNDDFLGRALTGKNGSYEIVFRYKDYADAPSDNLPDAYFKLYEGEELVQDTQGNIRKNLSRGEHTIDFTLSSGKNDKWVISGKIVQQDKKTIENLRIEAWELNNLDLGYLDFAYTDSKGAYALNFDRLKFVDLGRIFTPKVKFIIYSGDQIILETVANVAKELKPGKHKRNFTLKETPIDPPIPESIQGRVFLSNRLPANKISLRIYQKRFGKDLLLKTISTDEKGYYKLNYRLSDTAKAYEIRTTDKKGKEIVLSRTKFNVKEQETQHLIVPANLQRTDNEYSRLRAAVNPILGGISLGEAKETQSQADLSFLFQQTGWDARLIGMAALAEQRSAETDIPEDVLYALFRTGLPTGLEKLADVSAEAVELALQAANDKGISKLNVANGVQAVMNFSTQQLRTATTTGGLGNVDDFFQRAGLSEEDQNRMAKVFFQDDWKGKELWTKAVEADVSDTAIQKLQLQGKLAHLTMNNPALSEKLQTDLETLQENSGGAEDQTHFNLMSNLVEMGYYKADQWKTDIRDLAGEDPDQLARMIPAGFLSEEVEDRLDAYAKDMARKIRASYPTQSIAYMVGNSELKLGARHEEIKTPIQTFLLNASKLDVENSPAYVPGSTSLNVLIRDHKDSVLKDIPAELQAETLDEIKTFTRLYQLAPTDEAMQVLYDMGIKSAFDVVAYPYDEWMEFFAPRFRSPKEAKIILEKSEQTTAVLYNFYTVIELNNSSPAIPVNSPAPEQGTSIRNDLIRQFPSLESLFGSFDFCECEHCKSILSPAAYLVDILKFLDPSDEEWVRKKGIWADRHEGETYPGPKPYDALTARRPDLPHIMLTCKNTNTALPYIDIVNEILECYVDKENLDISVAYDTGEATSEELIAEPQHIREGAYHKVSEAIYPMDLPFDLSLEMARKFCEHFDIPYWKLLHIFRKTDTLFSEEAEGSYSMNDLFLEQLGFSPKEYTLFTQPDIENWFTLYGYNSEEEATIPLTDEATQQRIDLLSAKTLSRRLGLTYKELVQLVKSRFFNPALNELEILRSLQISTEEVFRWKDTGEYPAFSEEELAAFEKKLADASSPNFNAEEWLTLFWDNGTFAKVILIFDTNPGCNFDEATLRFANGGALEALEWTKLNLFVRLWKKLGWKMAEVDQALISFMPKDEIERKDNLGKKFETALIYLAHLKQLSSSYKLGKFNIQNWIGLWGDITEGENSIYKRHFLTYSILKENPIFDHPLGRYLSFETEGVFSPYSWNPEQEEDPQAGNVGLINHLGAVQGAFEMTDEEIRIILSEGPWTLETAPLNVEVLNFLYRIKVLREASKLSVDEIFTLKTLSGLEPNSSLASFPLSSLDEDLIYTQTFKFLDFSNQIKESSSSIEDLNYLLRHHIDPVGPYQTNEAGLVTLVRTLSQEFDQIDFVQAIPLDITAYTDEFLQEKLLLALSTEVANTFIGYWNSSQISFASTETAPEYSLPDNLLKDIPSLTFSYDEIREIQNLQYRGLLDNQQLQILQDKLHELSTLAEEDEEKISIAQRDLALALLKEVQEQARVFYTEHIHKPIFNGETSKSFDQWFPIIEPTIGEQAQLIMLAEKQQALGIASLNFLRKKLKEDLLVATLSEQVELENTFTKALLQNTQVLSLEGNSLQTHYLQANTKGASIRFIEEIDSGKLSGPGLVLPFVQLSSKDVPENTNQVWIEGYLECQKAEAYRIFIKGANADTKLVFRLESLANPLIEEQINIDFKEVSAWVELEANIPYRFTLKIEGFTNGIVEVEIQSESLLKGNLNQLKLYPLKYVENLRQAHTLLKKCVQLIQEMNLAEEEVIYLVSHPTHFYQFAFNQLPVKALDESVEEDKTRIEDLFEQWIRLDNYRIKRRELAGDSLDLIPLFEQGESVDATAQTLMIESLAKLSRRSVESIKEVFNHYGISSLVIAESDVLSKIWETLTIRHKFGIPIKAISDLAKITSKSLSHEERYPYAAAFKQAVKARYSPENWIRIAQSIFDKLRASQRDALVQYILHVEGFVRREQLFEYFLIDPGMEPVVQTSRIRLAISAIQTFIQRCLLNLELEVSPFMINRRHWEWMKKYRVWEANRKIFLFPENWLEPEFRDDKTHLFQELESAILQGDTNADLVEKAFFSYLIGLQKIARLNMVSMYTEEDLNDSAGNTIHLVGKAFSKPEYFYRTYKNNMWTPWVPIPAQMEGEHLALIKWQDRLHIFWLTFLQNAESKAGDADTESAASKSQADLIQDKVEIQLNWCEYFQGEWLSRETGGFENALKVNVPPDFSPADIYVHATKEYEDGIDKAVYVHLTGIDLAFRLVSKLAEPKFDKKYYGPPAEPPYSFDGKSKTKYIGTDKSFKVKYRQIITEITETENGVITNRSTDDPFVTPRLMTTLDSYKLLFYNRPLEISGDEEIDRLISPFFFEDDENSVTLYAEPELIEETTEMWEEWIIRKEKRTRNIFWKDYFDDLRVEAFVPYWDFKEFEDFIDPGVVDPLINIDPEILINPGDDWVTNPATVLQFGDDLLGARGGLTILQDNQEVNVPDNGAAAAVLNPVRVTVSQGSELAAGSALILVENSSTQQGNAFNFDANLGEVAENIHIIGSGGLNFNALFDLGRGANPNLSGR